MITIEQRKNKLYTSTDHIKEMYGSMVLASLLKLHKNSVGENEYNHLIDMIGDTILGFYKTAELPGLLQKEIGVSADDAQRIMGDLSEFLAPVIAREKEDENKNKVELQELHKTFSPASASEPVVTSTQTSQTDVTTEKSPTAPQEAHTTVQAMRTMEGDMSRIHGYGAYRAQFPQEPQEAEHTQEVIRSASQEDLLKEKPKLARMPTYEENGEET